MNNVPPWLRLTLLTSLLLAALTACSPYLLTITSFTAQPTAITAGGQTTLFWELVWTAEGPLPAPDPSFTVVITPGDVDVTELTSLVVAPTTTTTYILSATNNQNGEIITSEVTVTVTPINTAPSATDQSVDTTEDTPVAITLSGTDIDGDSLTFKVVSGPSNGTLSGTAPNLTYTPDTDFVGDDSFIFSVNDGRVNSGPATVIITVNGLNDAPEAVADSYQTDEDIVLTVPAPGVLDNDSDGDSNLLTANLVTGPSDGNLTLNADGSFSYTPNADFNGEDSFSYQANDGVDDSNVASVTIAVDPVNDPPEITSNGGGATASVTIVEDTTAVTDMDATDPEGDSEGAGLSYSLTGGADQALFALDANTGVLTFLAAPDFENPADADTDNDYEVQVTVTDSGGLTDVQDITVTVANIAQVPVITSDGGGATAAVTVAENATTVTDVQATDPDGDSEGAGLSYSLTGGADQAVFTIDTNTGVLTFSAAPDFENPSDANTNNIYRVEVTVTDSDGLTDAQVIIVTVTDVDEAPVITSSANVTTPENETAVTDVEASDPEGDTEGSGLTYTLTGGADQGFFAIDANTGVLTFLVGQDFENPADADTDGVYEVEVTVTDSGGGSDSQLISVAVNDGGEAPEITSDGGGATAAVNVAENQTAVTDVDATDPDGDSEGAGLSYSLTGGADQALFALDADTGVLTFLAAPDFENPTDADTDNDYEVQVTVTDTGLVTDVQDITVTVTDVDEAPVITSDGGGATAAVDAAENQTAVTDVDATDPEGETEGAGLSYSLTGGADQALFTIVANTGVLTFKVAPDFENPSDANTDNDYRVRVEVTDTGGSTDSQLLSVTVTDVNEDPVITSDGGGATAAVNVAENTTAVTDVQATDPEGDSEGAGLSYSRTGGADQGLFTINANTGVLTFNSAPDFENPGDANTDNDYEVQVTVTDSGGLTDVQDITVTVTDVNEPPEITSNGGGATASTSVPENTTAVTDVDATDPEGDTEGGGGLTYSLTTVAGGGIDNGFFTLNTSTGLLTFTTAPDFETPADDDGDNDYEVQVTVTDSGPGTPLTDLQDITVSVTGANDSPVVTPSGGSASFTEGAGAVAVDGTIAVSDPDDANLATATATITNIQDAGEELLAATPSGAIGAGEISFVAPTLTIAPAGGAPLADFVAVLQSVTYNNTSQDPDTSDRTVRFVANDGSQNSNNGDVTVTVTAVNNPPSLTAPGPYASTGNVGLVVPAGSGLLTAATISDPDFAGSFTVGGTVPTGTSEGGTVSITTSTGAFTYSPPAGFIGADTFDYQVCDNGTPLPSECSTAQTVTINVSGRIWFLDNSLGAAGNGTLATPFNTLAGFEAINGDGGATDPGAGDCIFLATGSGNYTGGVTLENTQILVGEGANAGIAAVCGITLPANSSSLPATGGTNPTIANAGGNGISLASGNTIRGLTVGTTSGTGISGSSFGTLTLSDTSVGGSGKALDLNTGTMSATFDSVTVTSSSTGGVSLQNLSGTTTFSSLDLTTTGGTGLLASSGGTVNIAGSSNAITATGGTGINLTSTTIGGSGVTFQAVSVDQSGSSPDSAGIILSNTGSGTFTVTGTGTTAGSGGTIQDILEDGIRLTNTDGAVSLSNLIIEDIGSTATASPGHHGIDGQQVDGGLTLDNVTIRRVTDSAIHGEAPGGGSTTWNGLTLTDSTLANSNRFHVGGVADGGATDEAMVTIEGISGTVAISDNDFDDGPGFINLFTASSGTVDITIQSNTFDDGRKDLAGVPSVGSSGIRVTTTGTIGADIRVGDPAEASSALGNTFTDTGSDAAIIVSGFSVGDAANVDVVISRNTVTVLDHTSPPGLGSVFDFPNGGIGVESRGSGTFEAIISQNTLVETQNSGGLSTGSLRVDISGDDSEVIVRNNTLTRSWDGTLFIRADDADGNGAQGFVLVQDNVYQSGLIGVPGSGDDLDALGFANSPAPFLPNRFQVRNGAVLDLTVIDDDMVSHDTTTNPQFDSLDMRINGDAVGGTSSTFNVLIQNTEGPEGFRFRNDDSGIDASDSEFNLSRGLSADPAATDILAAQAESVLDDNGNTTGGGGTTADVPFSGVNIVTTTPTLPVVTAP